MEAHRFLPQGRLARCLWALLPGSCVLCHQPSRLALDLCSTCLEDLPWNAHPCPRCGLRAPMPAEVCGACLSRPPPFVRTVAPLRYRGSALDLVRSLKFARSRITGRVLGELLTAAAQRAYESVTERPTVILPVPMSTRRLLRRGQNQAGVLARHVARGTGIPVDWDGCRRVRHTPPQTGQSRRVRLRNLAGAFACTRSFAGDSVAVVDDVMTTGATTLAISRALLASGAESVHVWVAARTERATMR